MKLMTRFASVAAVAATASLLSFGAAEAKNFKIAVGDSGGSSQEATGVGFVSALEELSGGKHTAKLFLQVEKCRAVTVQVRKTPVFLPKNTYLSLDFKGIYNVWTGRYKI